MKSRMLAFVLFTVFIAGCGNSSAEKSPDKPQKTVVRYAIWDEVQKKGIEAAIQLFEQKNPSIEIELEVTPWDQYWIRMEAAASGGQLADVFWMSLFKFGSYARAGIIEPLDQKISASDQIISSHYNQKFLDSFRWKGSLYGIPKDWDVTVFFLNKKLFEKAGVKVPETGWTYDQFLKTAQELRSSGKLASDEYPCGFEYDLQQYISVFLSGSGASVLNSDFSAAALNTTSAVSAVERMKNLVSSNLSITFRQMQDCGFASCVDPFLAGKIAMAAAGTWNLRMIASADLEQDNLDVTVLEFPEFPEKGNRFIGDGVASMIFSGSKVRDAAWKWVEFLASDEGACSMASEKPAIPSNSIALPVYSESFKQLANWDLSPVLKSSGSVTPVPYTANTPEWADPLTLYLVNEIISGNVATETGLSHLQEETDRIIKEQLK